MDFKFLSVRSCCSIGTCLAVFFWFQSVFSQNVGAAEIIAKGALSTSPTVASVELKDENVIYLGENHTRAEDHQQQLATVTQLQQDRGGTTHLAIAMEMFQRPFQPMLDRYLAGTIDADRLRIETEYDDRWGYDWDFYLPILQFAKAQQIPLIALNTPAEITRKVAESGLNSLSGSDWRYIPALEDIQLDNDAYRQRLTEIFQQHLTEGQGNSQDAENFYAAEVLWDETMAEAIADYHLDHPQTQIIALVGMAHVMYDYAIPQRVERRIQDPAFHQRVFLLSDL